MGPRERGGNFRGRGSRGRGGRGGARGRGRGRGGSSRFGPTRRFDGDRLADKDESGSGESDGIAEDEHDEEMDETVSEDDEEEKLSARPYMTLLQSFNDSRSSVPKAKRRKLEHPESRQRAESPSPPSEEEDAGEKRPEDVDQVDEEEDPTIGLDEQPDDGSDSEDEDAMTDPFDVHFAHPDELAIAKGVKAAKDGEWATKRAMVQSLRATMMAPGSECSFDAPQPASGLDDFNLKQKLKETAGKKMAKLDEAQKAVMPLLFDYRDVLHCDRTVSNSNSLRQAACLHALNHVFNSWLLVHVELTCQRTRDRVIKDNYKLAKDGEDTELELRDQGFTRPKVLFLVPTRNSCARIVNIIRDLCDIDQQENRKRFDESYIEAESNFGRDRPADFRDLFEGNDDDMFRLGVKFTRKTIKYFSQFYNSDILFASPLGMRMAIGSEEDKKKPDFDFLSSIEMVVVDQADGLLMQNWEHVEYVFEHLNQQPKDAHGCDFSRLRSWYLEDWAKYFRQTIIFSAFNTPELSELQRLHCHNWAGKVRLQPEYPGVIQQLEIKAKQTFSRFQSVSVDKDPDARFEYFVSAIVPTLVKRAKDSTGTLIFVPSYLDFVRVRNYFANSPAVDSVAFGAISEYTDVPEASRARSHFLSGRHRVLLYTERAHHFRRYQLRGVQKVICYGLPDNPIFYKEISGGYLGQSEQDLKIEPGQGTVRVLFSKYDVMKLERIVGSRRVGRMIQERGDTFDFI
ncbi:U3 small nucleolar RNA-associated protein 25 [Tolypocladium capitatum]|uniref:U3 small nucleolar RNA-associated protein 25 n=1 Tax=Tolypocladium capitatum TaxID=45235 RepID=A0A2K3Q8G7_9HYPO|nr:U3 small nucleolar RNA-associated protein 25 [Tolypocladium capitatum]